MQTCHTVYETHYTTNYENQCSVSYTTECSTVANFYLFKFHFYKSYIQTQTFVKTISVQVFSWQNHIYNNNKKQIFAIQSFGNTCDEDCYTR